MQFKVQSNDLDNYYWRWDFGDKHVEESELDKIEHSYEQKGFYRVTLTARPKDGGKAIETKRTIWVPSGTSMSPEAVAPAVEVAHKLDSEPPPDSPHLWFEYEQDPESLQVWFKCHFQGTVVRHLLIISGGDVYDEVEPRHEFQQPDLYMVKLWGMWEGGKHMEVELPVLVKSRQPKTPPSKAATK